MAPLDPVFVPSMIGSVSISDTEYQEDKMTTTYIGLDFHKDAVAVAVAEGDNREVRSMAKSGLAQRR